MGKSSVWRRCTRVNNLPDVTLINMNLMLVNNNNIYDQQAYLPLGILYIAAYLEREGVNVELADYQTFGNSKSFSTGILIDSLENPAPVVGISCMSNLLPFVIQFSKELKKVYPDRKIVLGGVGPSPVANEILDAFPYIDSVVSGEGEINMLRLLKGNFNRCPMPEFPKNLDDLPLPAYNLLDFGKYDASPSIITSRGCPYKCTFCTEPYNFGNSGTRFRNVDQILGEIELLHNLSGKNLFLFQDDILPLNTNRFMRLMEGFRKLSFPMYWKCFCRVDLITEEIMMEMVNSGCVQIRYGIESGCNKILEKIKKGFTIELAYQVVSNSIKYFPSVHVSFIWGYPFEDAKSFKETLRWVGIFENIGASVLLFELAPLPGSIIYESYQDNLVFDENHYSFFVITGHERVISGQFIHDYESKSLIELARKYPAIFPGFYRYRNSIGFDMKNLIENYKLNRRTKVRNSFDI